MKKFFSLLVALAMFAANATAYDYEPKEGFTWMGLLGMNVSDLQNHDYNAKVGATLGFRADYMLPKAHGTYVTAGIDWTMKGGRMSGMESVQIGCIVDEMNATWQYTLHYIELPIRLGFRYNVRESLGLYGEIGPYFAVGVGGRHSLTLDGDGSDVRNMEDAYSFRSFNSSDNLERQTFQRWDAGVGFRLGMEYNDHYNLMLGFDWGLADIYHDSLRDAYWNYMVEKHGVGERLPKVYNFNFNITAGYRF